MSTCGSALIHKAFCLCAHAGCFEAAIVLADAVLEGPALRRAQAANLQALAKHCVKLQKQEAAAPVRMQAEQSNAAHGARPVLPVDVACLPHPFLAFLAFLKQSFCVLLGHMTVIHAHAHAIASIASSAC